MSLTATEDCLYSLGKISVVTMPKFKAGSYVTKTWVFPTGIWISDRYHSWFIKSSCKFWLVDKKEPLVSLMYLFLKKKQANFLNEY
jgi:hypothetical protein